MSATSQALFLQYEQARWTPFRTFPHHFLMLHSSHSNREARDKSTSAFAFQVKSFLHCACLVLNYGNLTVVGFFQSLQQQQHLRTRGCAELRKRTTKKQNSITQWPSMLRWSPRRGVKDVMRLRHSHWLLGLLLHSHR